MLCRLITILSRNEIDWTQDRTNRCYNTPSYLTAVLQRSDGFGPCKIHHAALKGSCCMREIYERQLHQAMNDNLFRNLTSSKRLRGQGNQEGASAVWLWHYYQDSPF
jgi:hypothetical protein